MNAAHHASNILNAWRIQDAPGLGAALQCATLSRRSTFASSPLEHERGEALESIVDHLRKFDAQNQVPQLTSNSGAAALLLHLAVRGAYRESE